jgi:poly-gamma-glutamate capsule biosynthesis protein CapA/YwtB (metallophosphatase superfamily)
MSVSIRRAEGLPFAGMAVQCSLRRLVRRGIGAVFVIAAVTGCGSGGGSASTRAEVHHRHVLPVASTPTAREAKPAAKPRADAVKLTVEVNGDLLIHSPVWERALADGHGHYDFSPMLREITPFIKHADLAICHVETPMTPRPPSGYPVFNTPTQLARAIRKAGWRICDTASNHSVDQGQYGIDQTGRALDRAGILHTGSFGSSAAQNRTLIVTVKGVKVAFLAYTEMTNGIPLPHPWSVNLAHVAAVQRAARRARRRGAQVVIVNFHWGDEYVSEPSAFQRSVADALTRDPDITAIVGQHVHVVQPIQRVNGKLVVFGEGQLLSNQSSECCPVNTEDGMMVFLHLVVRGKRAAVTSVTYMPTWDRLPDYTVIPIGIGLAGHQAPADVLRASYYRTTSTVGRTAHVVYPMPAHIH